MNLRKPAGHPGLRHAMARGYRPMITPTVERVELSRVINQVVCMDALAFLRSLPDECVDLVVTSPPYNIRNSTGNGMRGGGWWSNGAFKKWYDSHDDNMPYAEYVAWQRRIIAECMRVLKSTGAMFYNHKWRVQNGLLQDRSEIVAGFPVRQVIIWDRSSGVNWNDHFFLPTYEVVYLIAKKDFRLKKTAVGHGDVWRIRPSDDTSHPCPFPAELPYRAISSTNARLVLDPFCGIGTALEQAQKLGRNYIGCDISQDYVDLARARLAQPYTPPLFSDHSGGESPAPKQADMFGEVGSG